MGLHSPRASTDKTLNGWGLWLMQYGLGLWLIQGTSGPNKLVTLQHCILLVQSDGMMFPGRVA